MNIILFLISLLHGAANMVLLRRFYRIFFTECKVSYYTEWFCYLLVLLGSTIGFFISNDQVNVNFIFGLITKIAVTYIYVGTHRMRLLLSLGYMLVVTIFELFLMVLMLPASVGVNETGGFLIFNTVGPLYSIIFVYMFVSIIEGIRSTKTGVRFSWKYWICFIATPILSFFIVLRILMIPDIEILPVAMCTVLLLILNITSFYFYEIVVSYITNKMEKRVIDEKNLYYAKQLETISEFADSMRSFQHDLKHHAIVLDSYMQKEEYDKMKVYYDDILRYTKAYDSVVHSGNTTIDSILNYKSFEARNKGIRMDLSVAVPCEMTLTSSELVVVLGNLLDNAMEATVAAEEPFIGVKLIYDRGCLMIRIKNSHNNQIKKESGRFLSTKDHSLLHGYGLRNVKRIVDDNGGTMDIHDAEGIFAVDVLLNDSKKK